MEGTNDLLRRTAELAIAYLDEVGGRPVGVPVDPLELRVALDGALPDAGGDELAVVSDLAARVDPGLVASAGPRYFGFVTGGAHPAALAADWLTSAWDQNAVLYASSPASAAVEQVVERWFVDLVGLPGGTAVGFTSGATMANFTALAVARRTVLERAGWNVDARGLIGGPAIRILVGDEVHATVPYALRLLGLGHETAIRVPADSQGAMRADALDGLVGGGDGPTIVCAQAGNVNTGAFDPLEPIAEIASRAGAWLHVDGAFGLWAVASPALRAAVAGIERADSLATDAHKWLNVPYDSGLVAVRDRDALRRTMSMSAAYLVAAEGAARDPHEYVPEASRRARGFVVYAALQSLGRSGIRELVDRCCALARRFADRLRSEDGIEILNEVVLNQVLVRFTGSGSATADDERTRAVIAAVQRDGTMWAGGTVWRGKAAMRISVSSWSTTESDVDRSVEAIVRSAQAPATRAPTRA